MIKLCKQISIKFYNIGSENNMYLYFNENQKQYMFVELLTNYDIENKSLEACKSILKNMLDTSFRNPNDIFLHEYIKKFLNNDYVVFLMYDELCKYQPFDDYEENYIKNIIKIDDDSELNDGEYVRYLPYIYKSNIEYIENLNNVSTHCGYYNISNFNDSIMNYKLYINGKRIYEYCKNVDTTKFVLDENGNYGCIDCENCNNCYFCNNCICTNNVICESNKYFNLPLLYDDDFIEDTCFKHVNNILNVFRYRVNDQILINYFSTVFTDHPLLIPMVYNIFMTIPYLRDNISRYLSTLMDKEYLYLPLYYKEYMSNLYYLFEGINIVYYDNLQIIKNTYNVLVINHGEFIYKHINMYKNSKVDYTIKDKNGNIFCINCKNCKDCKFCINCNNCVNCVECLNLNDGKYITGK